jgi:hypothetical protein
MQMLHVRYAQTYLPRLCRARQQSNIACKAAMMSALWLTLLDASACKHSYMCIVHEGLTGS